MVVISSVLVVSVLNSGWETFPALTFVALNTLGGLLIPSVRDRGPEIYILRI